MNHFIAVFDSNDVPAEEVSGATRAHWANMGGKSTHVTVDKHGVTAQGDTYGGRS